MPDLANWTSTKQWLRSQFFRFWTAGAVLGAFAFGWIYLPQTLTWWKRTTTALIEHGCDLLPYPWGDRLEATLGNFGLWVQITLAIVAFRMLVWLLITVSRRVWRATRPKPDRLTGKSAE